MQEASEASGQLDSEVQSSSSSSEGEEDDYAELNDRIGFIGAGQVNAFAISLEGYGAQFVVPAPKIAACLKR